MRSPTYLVRLTPECTASRLFIAASENKWANTSKDTGGLNSNRLISESEVDGIQVEESYIAAGMPFGRVYVLPKIVSAIPILPSDESGSLRLGLLTQLPESAEIEIGGPGFNDSTIRVKCGAASYYVFLDDLELVRKYADAACA